MSGGRVPEDLLVHLRRAHDEIDRHYAEPLDLDRLAGLAGMSKYHFLRCFAAVYGHTPAALLIRRRIERAQDLLRATNLTVTEVCVLVGYSSLGSFSTRFRRLVGASPSEYQARWSARGAPRIPGCFVFMHGISDVATDVATPEKPGGAPGHQLSAHADAHLADHPLGHRPGGVQALPVGHDQPPPSPRAERDPDGARPTAGRWHGRGGAPGAGSGPDGRLRAD